MTTDTQAHAVVEPEHEEGGHAHPSDGLYVRIAILLAVFTAIEIAIGESSAATNVKIPSLIILMVVKFALVIWFFMHLRFDAKLFGRMFYAGLALALGVYLATLTTFHFWR